MRRIVAAIALLMLTAPASASLIEDAIADFAGPGVITYQEDGGVPGDAPATCPEATIDRAVSLQGAASSGMLVDMDDESDAYGFVLEEAVVGERVAVSLLTGLLVDRYDIAFDVLSPDCASSVFDPESAYYDPAPAAPYEPGLGEVAVEGRVTGYDCDPAGWKVLANQMRGAPAPEDIYMEWTDGSWEFVPLSKSTPATIAQYRTSSNLDVTVARIVIVVPATWSGQFHVASGPCDAVQGTNEPPTSSPRYAEFTAQEAGTHVVVVYIARGTVDKTVDTVMDLVANPPTSSNMNCHSDICTGAMQFTKYDIGSNLAS